MSKKIIPSKHLQNIFNNTVNQKFQKIILSQDEKIQVQIKNYIQYEVIDLSLFYETFDKYNKKYSDFFEVGYTGIAPKLALQLGIAF